MFLMLYHVCLMTSLDSSNCLVQYWDSVSSYVVCFCIVYIGWQYCEHFETYLSESVCYLDDHEYVLIII